MFQVCTDNECLTNDMVISLSSKTGLMVKNQDIRPLNPNKFVWRGNQNYVQLPRGESAPAGGLRDTPDKSYYEWFCENFLECVIPTKEWKLHAKRRKMLVYVYPGLEAFAVLVYKNSFSKWDEFFGQEIDDQTDASSLTTGLGAAGGLRFLYTGDSKGSRKYEGWSAEGMKMFNGMFDMIRLQRALPGCSFEQNLLKKIAASPRIGREQTSASDAPRVRNNVADLMQQIGV